MNTDFHRLGRASRHRRSHAASFVLKALPSALMLVFSQAGWSESINGGAGAVAGLPINGVVSQGGDVQGGVIGNTLTVTQPAARAVIDWASFNIDPGKAVHFAQPVGGAVLNRVSAATNASQISGALSADGMVMLMNPHGVLFNQGSSVNVGALIATTGTIDENTFTNTSAQITGATRGTITNQGNIAASAGASGLVALVAPSVINQGVITATGGTIALLGSTAATISLNNGLYEFAIPGGATGTEVTNAAGATLNAKTLHLGVGDAANLLSGVINLEGIQQASSAIVVNGDTVVLKSALQAPSVSGNSNKVDVYDGARIQDAIGIAKVGTPGAGAAVDVHGGAYAEQLLLNKANMTLTGHDGAKILVPDSSEVNGISISANNVTVTGMEIAGPATQSYLTYAWGNNRSRGIAVSDGVTGFTLSNNNIHDVRNGILIHGNNTGSVTGNRIDNTKSAISVQYTDGNGITMSGNTQGSLGNEWGLNLHLNGHMVGSTIVENITPISAAPTLSWQQSLLDLSAANAGWSVQDQAYTSSNRTHVNVAEGGLGTQGSLLAPLNSVQAGINAVVTGGIVNVAAGNYVQPTTLTINKSLTLTGAGQGATIIDTRGVTAYGMEVSANNVSLKDFTLYGPTANTESAYGIKVAPLGTGASLRLHDFSIRDVTIRGSGKAELDLNGVVGATIDGVTADGAPVGNDAGSTRGAGIQITDSANVTVRNSTTRNNQWGGLALYQANFYRDQQVNNITVAASNNFTELNPVYLQDQSASRDFGTLSIAGFDYAVRNGSSTNSNLQYTWLQASRQNAFDFAVRLGASASSYIQGWNGAVTTQNFHVGTGNLSGGGSQAMSIVTAVDTAAEGAEVNVYAGTFSENVRIGKALTLKGAGVGQSIVDPVSGDAFAISGNIGAGSTVLIDGFTFRDAPGSGVSVAGDTVLGQLTVKNSSFRNNGHYGFSVNGTDTAGVPGLANVLLSDNTFEGNGNPAGGATALGLGDVHFNYFNGNATLKNLRITGTGEHTGIHFRGYHNASGGAVHNAGTLVFDNVTLEGSFRRPSSTVGTWNPGGPGYAIHLFEYGSVANVSFNDVAINATVGHGLAVEGLGSTLDIGNTRFGMADTSVTGTGTNPTASLNIMTGSNSQNNVKTNINATAASFTGAATGFDIEDRVGHALDSAGSGLVTWNAGNVYVTQKSASVQRGVDAASAGDTVNVGAGTYAESVNITKALTLDGAGMGQTVLKATTANGDAVTVNAASNVSLSDLSIADSANGLLIKNTSNNLTLNRVALNNNRSGIRTEHTARADNFRMLNSTITGGEIGVQTYSRAGATGSFANALFENVTVDGPTFKGFYFETADNLTMKNVTITNAGNYGAPATSDDHKKYGAAIDINLKYADFNTITLENVVVKDSGYSSGSDSRAAVVIKTRGIPGDSSGYVAAPASLQSVNIIGGSIEGSRGTGIRFETLSKGNGGQSAVTISGGTQFKNNGQDIVVDRTSVDARGAVFVDAADGFAVEDRVRHALDSTSRGLVTWNAGNVYVTQASGSIQRGVDAAGIGDTVNVANASFAENVAVNSRRNLAFNDTRLQSLTLGSGAAGSGIGGSVTAEGTGGIVFNAPVTLLADTTLATTGADITLNGDIQNAGDVARGLRLLAGSGAARGNVHMNTGGSAARFLGQLDVVTNDFKLDSTLWVGSYKIDALGKVALSNSTLRAQDTGGTNTLNAGGDVTGSTISQARVEVTSAGDIQGNISGTDVVAQAQGAMEVVVTASQTATLTAETIVANVTAADVVASSQGDMNMVVAASNSASLTGDSVVANVTAPVLVVEAVNDAQISGAVSQVTLDAPRGSVSGSFGQVSNAGGGLVNVNGKPQGNATLSGNTENNRVIPAGGVQDSGAEGGTVLLTRTGDPAPQGGTAISLSTPEAAGEALDSGRAVELDMSPRKQGAQNNKKDKDKDKAQGE